MSPGACQPTIPSTRRECSGCCGINSQTARGSHPHAPCRCSRTRSRAFPTDGISLPRMPRRAGRRWPCSLRCRTNRRSPSATISRRSRRRVSTRLPARMRLRNFVVVALDLFASPAHHDRRFPRSILEHTHEERGFMTPRRIPLLGSSLAILLVVLAATNGRLSGQAGTPTREWRTWGGDLANTKYSPLEQINKDNFNTLEVAWRFKTDALGPRPEFNYETTPLMVNGVVFATAGTRRSVVALDAATGELLWMHREDEGARGDAAPRKLSGRGLAYWSDATEQRVIYVTPGYRLVALDAKTGIPVPGFGKSGTVDL